jgi:hypothetical protein
MEVKMLTDRRLLTGGILSALTVAWIFIALTMPNGFLNVFVFFVPAALLAVAGAWLFFTFAGSLFTWSRAATSVVVVALVLTPILAFFFGTSLSQDLTTKFLFIVALAWAASMGGTLWNLAGAAGDAFREWRASRNMRRQTRRIGRPRRVYVPYVTPRSETHFTFGNWDTNENLNETRQRDSGRAACCLRNASNSRAGHGAHVGPERPGW